MIFKKKFQGLIENDHQHAEVELVTKSGKTIFVDCLARVIRNKEGEIENILVFERTIKKYTKNEKGQNKSQK
jgi:hypothetical protein